MKFALVRLVGGMVAGGLVFLSYQPVGWWWAAIVGVALLFVVLAPWPRGRGPSLRLGAGIAVAHSLVLFLLLLPWIGSFVGTMPYVALAIWLSLYSVLLGVLGVAVARLRFGPLMFPLVFMAVEWLRSTVPFGGFAWVRLGWGQVGGPLQDVASVGGPALVSGVVVAVGCCVGAVALRRPVLPVASLLGVVALLAVGASVSLGSADVGSVRVAAIQGNVPRLGLEFNAQRRAVLANHVAETKKLAGSEPVDMVVWPENSADVSPFYDAQAADMVSEAVAAAGAPVLVGTITRDEVGLRNTMSVFNPGSEAGDFHYKRYLQPFGEYMPLRSFFRLFSEKVDWAGDFKPGVTSDPVRMGDVLVGEATCYEVAFDNAGREAVRRGAQILTTPTNNATFGFSDMTYQQLAMSRMLAIQTDRAVVVAATSGVSAMVHPDGSVSQETEIFTAATLRESLPLRESQTIAVRFGFVIEYVLVLAGWLVGAGAVIRARRSGGGFP